MIIDHGTFTLYTPTRPIIPPRPSPPVDLKDESAERDYAAALEAWEVSTGADRRLITMLDSRVLFLRNAQQVDWYSIANSATSGRTFVMLRDDKVIAHSADPTTLWPLDVRVVETDQPVAIDDTFDGTNFAQPLADAKAKKVAMAWGGASLRIASGSVSVATSAGTHNYSIDAQAQDNIKAVLIGVALNVTPSPRPWTPKGALAPVQLTHDDLKLVGATMMARVDAIIQAYLTHKTTIMSATTVEAVNAIDLTAGWP